MATCGHVTTDASAICRHLIANTDLDHRVRFTGVGKTCLYLCDACAATPGELVTACAACRAALGWGTAFEGAPAIVTGASTIGSSQRGPRGAWPAFSDLQPIHDGDRARFVGVTADGTLHAVDADAGTARVIASAGLALARPMLRLSRDGTLAALVDAKGLTGAVIDLAAGRTVMPLARGDYCAEHNTFPVAFVERGDRTLLAHATDWNRLELVDPRTGENLAARGETDLDYFHSGLDASPDGVWVADNGWHWHPYGALYTWRVDAWLANPFECDRGPTRRQLTGAAYLWDRPICWLGGSELAVWGLGDDDTHMLPAVRIFDAATGDERDWFYGPAGDLVFDRELLSIGARGLEVWDLARGARLFADATVAGVRYHPGAKRFVALADGTVTTLRGADARYSGRVAALAARIAHERVWEDLHVLGDALESEGCTDAALLAHCHAPGPHADRCWAIDRISDP